LTGTDLLKWIRKAPFEPFRIRLNSGRTFDVRHPEMALVSATSVILVTYRGDPPDLYEDLQMLGLQLVESIEPIEPKRLQEH
jgi:hypothetical protein